MAFLMLCPIVFKPWCAKSGVIHIRSYGQSPSRVVSQATPTCSTVMSGSARQSGLGRQAYGRLWVITEEPMHWFERDVW